MFCEQARKNFEKNLSGGSGGYNSSVVHNEEWYRTIYIFNAQVVKYNLCRAVPKTAM